jgi:hypothetical protein
MNKHNFHIPIDPKKEATRQREKRIQERIANPKANPTNREVMEAINDLSAELLEQKKAK